jgi:hypothetical protein
MSGRGRIFALPLSDRSLVGPCVAVGRLPREIGSERPIRLAEAVKRKNADAIGFGSRGSTPAPVRHCRQVQVGSFSTQHGKGAISPSGATTTVCD